MSQLITIPCVWLLLQRRRGKSDRAHVNNVAKTDFCAFASRARTTIGIAAVGELAYGS